MIISELSVRRPVFATVASLLLIIFGLVSLDRLAVREYPNIDRPVVSVETTYRGAAAAVVENKVTEIIEERIAGIEGIRKIESESEDERSNIRIEFDVSRDIDSAANDVRDRVARALDALPPEVDPPQVVKADASADPVMYLNVSSDTMSILELTDYVDRNLADRFSTVPGVARVSLNGARRYAMRIWLDRQALAARKLTVADIENTLRRENVQLPAGRLESRSREFSLRTDVGLQTPDDFRQLVIGRGEDGHLIRLGEVAQVELSAEDERNIARTNGRPGISLGIEAQSQANTLDVVRGVREELKRAQASLPPGMELAINMDRGVAIEAALKEVLIALAFAFISVLIVIYAFLGNLRATFIPAITIPVSIMGAFIVMYALGYTINVLTLLGLVLAIGLVVDDAIVVVENIHRRNELGEPPVTAAVRGSHEIGFAVIATTLTLVAVFVPLSFLQGDIGRLFREFGFTLAASVLFSAFVALTLTPMLTSKLPHEETKRGRVAGAVERFFARLSAAYSRRLTGLIRRPWLVVASMVVLVLAGILTFRSLPSEFAPVADNGVAVVFIEGPEGASLEYMEEYGRRLEEIIREEQREVGDIERVMLRIPGRFGGSGDVNSARSFIVLKHWDERERSSRDVGNALLAKLRHLPGVRANAFQPGGIGSSSFQKPVQAVIGGPDYETLAEWSKKLVALAEKNPGLTSVDTDYRERKPQVRVAVDRNRAADLGVSLETVGRTLETMLGSRIVTTYVDRGREYNVILQGRADERQTITDLTNLHVRSDRTGELIPLANLVRLEETSGAIELNRFDRLRAVEISANLVGDYSLGDAVKWFQETVARELPGATLKFDGPSGDYLESGQQLYYTFLLAIAVVFLVLAAQFESFVHPTIIMMTVPLALLGAVFGLKLYGMSINIFSQIAVILLIGIAAKNGVLIVEFANQLRDRGVEFNQAVVQAAVTRLRPVLMTSLCTAFGAIPFLLATGAGAEQRRPIGIVVFYGTLVAVLLTLFAVPAMYSLLARKTKSPEYMSRIVDQYLSGKIPAPAGEATARSDAS
ncbi:MAG TPA: efflux RND transporter permease subunit [Steroidobacteraceae bacterium]